MSRRPSLASAGGLSQQSGSNAASPGGLGRRGSVTSGLGGLGDGVPGPRIDFDEETKRLKRSVAASSSEVWSKTQTLNAIHTQLNAIKKCLAIKDGIKSRIAEDAARVRTEAEAIAAAALKESQGLRRGQAGRQSIRAQQTNKFEQMRRQSLSPTRRQSQSGKQ
jgi:hypothetical protein